MEIQNKTSTSGASDHLGLATVERVKGDQRAGSHTQSDGSKPLLCHTALWDGNRSEPPFTLCVKDWHRGAGRLQTRRHAKEVKS